MGGVLALDDSCAIMPGVAARQAITSLVFVPPRRDAAALTDLRCDPHFLFLQPLSQEFEEVAALHINRSAPVTLLYCHGNGEDLLDIHGLLHQLADALNVNVLGCDYPGYGLSPGICSEAGCNMAAEAMLQHLLRQGEDRADMVVMGRSLGSGPAVELASRQPGLRGLVLQSPFLSILRTRLSLAMVQTMEQADMFDNRAKLPLVECPVLVLHGLLDKVVPLVHGEELCRLAPNAVRPWWVVEKGHNDLTEHEEYYRKLEEFLEFLEARQKRQWKQVAAGFTQKMMVRHRPAKKLLLTAL